MLILTRKPRQRILIGDDIVVEILAIRGGQIRVGITAPPSVIVLREELPAREPRPPLERTA